MYGWTLDDNKVINLAVEKKIPMLYKASSCRRWLGHQLRYLLYNTKPYSA